MMTHMHFSEWFAIAMLVFTVGAPVFFLILSFMRHHLDDPQCAKYGVFTSDPSSHADIPAACKPSALHQRSWWNTVNVGWVWFSLAVAAIWAAIVLGAFVASHWNPTLH